MNPEDEAEEDGANIDLDSQRKGKCVVLKTSTRQVSQSISIIYMFLCSQLVEPAGVVRQASALQSKLELSCLIYCMKCHTLSVFTLDFRQFSYLLLGLLTLIS